MLIQLTSVNMHETFSSVINFIQQIVKGTKEISIIFENNTSLIIFFRTQPDDLVECLEDMLSHPSFV